MTVVTHHQPIPMSRPAGGLRGCLYDITNNPTFEKVVFAGIILNSLLMACEHYGQSEAMGLLLEWGSLGFICAFTIETGIRFTLQGYRRYFSDPWNMFDFLIVTSSVAMIPLGVMGTSIKVSAIRPFRLLLVFRVIKHARGVRLMVTTLLVSLPALLNVAAILFLLFFLYAIIGVQLFGNIKYGQQMGPHANFRSFGAAMQLLFRVLTGGNWNLLMADCMVMPPACTPLAEDISGYYLPDDCGSHAGALLFFVSFYTLASYTVMNLFIAVIVEKCPAALFCFLSEHGVFHSHSPACLQLFVLCQLRPKRDQRGGPVQVHRCMVPCYCHLLPCS